ncbi:Uncharacterised protein [Bergeriella denitrificans]|uniref:Uncharacterized protein n=1 Tax=Bergeriella denitrificans TaxID=494 RepID=A0A378UHZ2_BERDE|nr:Uncharacterised protein [Bergeriella denitrificans]
MSINTAFSIAITIKATIKMSGRKVIKGYCT